MPFVTNNTPHLIHLSLVGWLDDDIHILWREGPYDNWLIHVLPLWFFFFMC